MSLEKSVWETEMQTGTFLTYDRKSCGVLYWNNEKLQNNPAPTNPVALRLVFVLGWITRSSTPVLSSCVPVHLANTFHSGKCMIAHWWSQRPILLPVLPFKNLLCDQVSPGPLQSVQYVTGGIKLSGVAWSSCCRGTLPGLCKPFRVPEVTHEAN